MAKKDNVELLFSKYKLRKPAKISFNIKFIALFRNYFTKVVSQHADCECNSTQLIQCGKVDLGMDHKKSDGGWGKSKKEMEGKVTEKKNRAVR